MAARWARPASRPFLVAGVAQLAATAMPAAHVRLMGTMSFLQLPTAGVALMVLGVLTLAVALRPGGWWRWGPGVCSAIVAGVAYWRLRWSPSGSFVDPVLRHAVRPAWGFVPLGIAIAIALFGALRRPADVASSPSE